MSKRLLAAIAALAGLGLAAGAVPAFTADSGTVTVSVTAQAPAAPCLTVTPDNVSFETLPFSRPGIPGISAGDSSLTTTNCGTAGQHLLGSATNASGPEGSWGLVTPPGGGSGNTCDDLGGIDNSFYLRIAPTGGASPFDVLFLSATPTLVPGPSGAPALFPAGSSYPTQLRLYMPCQGSNGGAKTITATFTALIP